jgi:hypothetical protein
VSISHNHDMDPRIRILSCDAVAPPRRKRDWRLPVAAVLVAVFGVGSTLILTSLRQPRSLVAQPDPPVAVEKVDIVVLGSADARVARPTREVHRAIRSAVSADFRGAARVAQVPESTQSQVLPQTPAAVRLPGSSATSSGGTTTAVQAPDTAIPKPVPQAPTGTVSKPGEQAPSGTVRQPVESAPHSGGVGPESAPGAGNPVDPAQ